MMSADRKEHLSRRAVLRGSFRGAILVGLGGAGYALAKQSARVDTVWQIDPWKCTACGKCATNCVLEESAVKCVHAFSMCGRCDLCTGFFQADPVNLDQGAENQLCPTGALVRTKLTEPYYEYTIDEAKCIGCAKCVEGCEAFGNGSLYMQVRHDRCLNCNDCTIARNCPADAFVRVPAESPYLLKDEVRPE